MMLVYVTKQSPHSCFGIRKRTKKKTQKQKFSIGSSKKSRPTYLFWKQSYLKVLFNKGKRFKKCVPYLRYEVEINEVVKTNYNHLIFFNLFLRNIILSLLAFINFKKGRFYFSRRQLLATQSQQSVKIFDPNKFDIDQLTTRKRRITILSMFFEKEKSLESCSSKNVWPYLSRELLKNDNEKLQKGLCSRVNYGYMHAAFRDSITFPVSIHPDNNRKRDDLFNNLSVYFKKEYFSECFRLRTFKCYNSVSEVSSIKLAEKGFIAIPSECSKDRIMCAFCLNISENLQQGEQLMHSENCIINRGENNIAIKQPSNKKALISYLDQKLSEISKDKRRILNESILNTSGILKNEATEINLINKTTNIRLRNEIRRQSKVENEATNRIVRTPSIPRGLRTNRNTQFSPNNHDCFFCGVRVDLSGNFGDLWVRHALANPNCGYVKLARGHNYVTTVRELGLEYDHDQITEEMVLGRMNVADINLGPVSRQMQQGNADHTGSSDDLESLQQENAILSARLECQECHVEQRQVVFLPCGHLLTCVACSVTLQECSMCHTFITGFKRVFFN